MDKNRSQPSVNTSLNINGGISHHVRCRPVNVISLHHLINHTGRWLPAIARNFIFRVFFRVSLVRMMGTEDDIIQIRPLFSQKNLKLSVNHVHLLHTAHSPGYHRLIGHNDGKISRLINELYGFCRMIFQLQLFLSGNQTSISIHRPVPV